MASKFKIQKFRTNDLSSDSGKQFELGKSWCEDFFEIPSTVSEFVVNLVFKPLTEAQLPYKDKVIELKLSTPTARADRKAYANGEYGQSQIKEFFIHNLKLQNDNLQDYFALYKAANNQCYLYVVPYLLYDNFVKLFTDTNLSIINKKNNIQDAVLKRLQIIYYGAPGTGKSHIINEQVCNESVIRTTFHPDSDYSTFVGCYKPTTKTVKMRDLSGHVIKENGVELTEDRIVYEFVEQAFLQAYIQAWKFYDRDNEEVEKQFLVIEEINRGNCAQIFGDLFQLLDRNMWGFSDYPIKADNDMRKQLAKAFNGLEISQENKDRINACYKGGKDIVKQVLSGEILLLPDNFYIWATMNTSDQSLFPIDSAFKRRWDWQYMPISKGRENGMDMDWSIVANDNEYDWWSFLDKINEQVGSTTNSEDKKLGFFFCKAVNGKISAETFVGKVIFYLWNDVFKDFGFDNAIFNDEDGSTLSFDKFYATENGKVIVRKDKVELFLKNLGVDIVSETIDAEVDESEEDEDGNSSSTSERDYTKYSINGVGSFGKNRLASECVKEYIKLHPDMPANEVIRKWKSLGYIVPHLIESKEEFEARTDNSKGRSSEIPCGSTVLYVVRNGFGRNRKVDVLIQKVNEKDWGIKVDKVE